MRLGIQRGCEYRLLIWTHRVVSEQILALPDEIDDAPSKEGLPTADLSINGKDVRRRGFLVVVIEKVQEVVANFVEKLVSADLLCLLSFILAVFVY